jgi:tetratricopeptide (TPR) repeat protein
MSGDAEKFLRFTQRAAQLFPDEPRVSYLGALALNQLKRYPEAAQAYERTEKLAQTRLPDLLGYSFYFAHGVALERSEKFEEASKKFQKSIELTPPDDPARAASAMNYLGFMWADRSEHLDKAEELIRKANELQPESAAYIDSLGWLYFRQGKTQEALAELQRAEQLLKEIEPDDAEILDHIAQAHDKLGQRAKAEEYWKRVLALKPPNEKLVQSVEKSLGISKPKPQPKNEPPALESKPAKP